MGESTLKQNRTEYEDMVQWTILEKASAYHAGLKNRKI